MHGTPKNLKTHSNLLDFFLDQFNVQDGVVNAWEILAKSFEQPFREFRTLPWEQILEKYDKYSLRSWLSEHANLTMDTIDYISSFTSYEAFLDTGLVEILVDECVFIGGDKGPQFQYIRHGMDLLPRAMAKNLPIQFNSKVTKIDQTSNKIKIKVDCKGIMCSSDEDDMTVETDLVILTTPAGPTLSIEFEPNLSVQKNHALRTNTYMSSTKVLLSFEYPFWLDDNNNKIGGKTLTVLPVKQIYYEMNASTSGKFIYSLFFKLIVVFDTILAL